MPQPGKALTVSFKVETTLNTAPTATGGEVLRFAPSPGLTLQKDAIRSNEVRGDGLTSIARHGSQSVTGSYAAEMSVGSHDTIFEAAMRASAVAAVVVTALTASLAEIITGSNTIEATTTGAGSWAAAGLRVGDVFRISGQNAANNDLNLRLKSMTTHTLTVHGTPLTVDASAETGFSITTGKKLSNPSMPVRRSFYVDEYNKIIDQSEAFGGVRFTGFTVRGTPNGMAEVTFNAMGMSASVLASGASPYFSDNTEYTSEPLVFADAILSLGGTELAVGTSFELNYEITANTLPVIGSAVTPDVFDNDARLSGSLTILREDLTRLSSFIDEDELELMVLLQEPEAVPKDYFSFYVPKLKFMAFDAPLGSDNAMVDTMPWEAGFRASATGFDQTLLTILTSAT